MNSNPVIPVPTLITCILWTVVLIFLGVCWHGWWTDDADQTRLGGFTAAAFVGPATVAHIRLYAARVCGVVRAVHQPPPESGVVLQRIH